VISPTNQNLQQLRPAVTAYPFPLFTPFVHPSSPLTFPFLPSFLLPLPFCPLPMDRLLTLFSETCIVSDVRTLKNDRKKLEKRFLYKCMHVGVGSSKTKQRRWEYHHNTFTSSLHLVPFCQPCTILFTAIIITCGILNYLTPLYADTDSALPTLDLSTNHICHAQHH